jgi:hypothetical protein
MSSLNYNYSVFYVKVQVNFFGTPSTLVFSTVRPIISMVVYEEIA